MTRISLYFLLLIAVWCSLGFLWVGLFNETLDFHAFRQSQTAISSYWFLHGGAWLPYETPVLGYPWAIPFEFPIYQLIVAFISKLGVPLNPAGRLVSYAFFLLCLLPSRYIFRKLNIKIETFLVFQILLFCSPLYIFWSRSFMIETTALFFSLAWFCALLHVSSPVSKKALALCVVFGTLAGLTKSTTFLLWGVLGLLLACYVIFQNRKGPGKLGLLAALAVAGLIPLIIGYAWVRYSDIIKTENPLGGYFISEALGIWNFGTIAQRLSGEIWYQIVFKRMLYDVFGYGVIPAIVALCIALTTKRRAGYLILSVVLYISSFLIFTNLYIVHNYYQVASAVFILFAVAIGIGTLFDRGMPILAVVMVAVIAAGQLAYANNFFLPSIENDVTGKMKLRVASIARDMTAPDETLLVFGDDWSSEMLYYAQRKGLAVPSWLPEDKVDTIIASPEQLFGGQHLRAVIDCREPATLADLPRVNAWVSALPKMASEGQCQIYRYDR